jgi:hypothetical protein
LSSAAKRDLLGAAVKALAAREFNYWSEHPYPYPMRMLAFATRDSDQQISATAAWVILAIIDAVEYQKLGWAKVTEAERAGLHKLSDDFDPATWLKRLVSQLLAHWEGEEIAQASATLVPSG